MLGQAEKAALSVIVGLFLQTVCVGEVQYQLIELGDLGFGESRARDVNDAAQVTGWSRTVVNSFSYQHAYRYDESPMTDLSTLVGDEGSSQGYGINASGQVAGYSETEDGSHAFRWTDSNGNGGVDVDEMIDLGTQGGPSSFARDINDSGQVAGTAQVKPTLLAYDHAFRWTDSNGNNQVDSGEMLDPGTLSGNVASPTNAWGINNNGSMVGQGQNGIQYHAFYWTEAGGIIDLGTFGGSASHAYDVNDAEQVVGLATTASNTRAFLWEDNSPANGVADPGEMIDLGSLGGEDGDSHAYGINNQGIIVGDTETTPNEFHAFIYEDNIMTDLNDLIDPASGWFLEEAHAISDNGNIVGLGKYNGLPGQAFLLIPISAPVLTGDYNGDGTVDAADYTVWRDALEAGAETLTNRDPDNSGPVSEADYLSWRMHFGDTSLPGSGALAKPSGAAVPEPTTLLLLLLGALAIFSRQRAAVSLGRQLTA